MPIMEENKFYYGIFYCPFSQKVFCRFPHTDFDTSKDAESYIKDIIHLYPGTSFIVIAEHKKYDKTYL